MTPARWNASGDLRELIGEDACDLFEKAHWDERDRGVDALRLEIARLRADGVVPSFPRFCTPKTIHGKAAAELRACGLDAQVGIFLSLQGPHAEYLSVNGVRVDIPPGATVEDVIASVLGAMPSATA